MGALAVQLPRLRKLLSGIKVLGLAAVMESSSLEARRQFLKFLAASPYVAALGGVAAFFDHAVPRKKPRKPLRLLRTRLRPQRLRFRGSGAPQGSPGTLGLHGQRCRRRRHLRAIVRLSNISNCAPGASTTPQGRHARRPVRHRYDSPIFTCPTGGQKSFPPTANSLWQKQIRPVAPCKSSRQPHPHGGRREQGPRAAGLVSAVRPYQWTYAKNY